MTEYSEEDLEQLRLGTIAVREILQDAANRVTDKQIQDALWHYYYDVEKSVAYILNTYMEIPKAKPQKKESEKGKGKKVQGGFVYFFLFVLVYA
jgi:elongation factor 1 alpha-like protein